MDIATGFWYSKVIGNATTASTLRFNYRRAATHGDTGRIYIPGGANNGTMMVVLDPETFVETMVGMPPIPVGYSGVIGLYGWVWSDLRKSFLLTCGEFLHGEPQNGDYLSYNMNSAESWEYFPDNNTWAPLVRLTSFWLCTFMGFYFMVIGMSSMLM